MTDAPVSSLLGLNSMGTPNVNNYGWCQTDMKKIKFGYVWTINNFSYLQEDTGECVESSTFSSSADDKHKWYLQLFPRGEIEENEDYVSLFLLHIPESLEIGVVFEFSILNNNREKTKFTKVERHKFTSEQSDWGFDNYIKRDDLMDEGNGFLPNDVLTICCEVVIVDKPKVTSTGHYNALGDTRSSLLDDLGHLLKSKDFSDVILVVEEKELHAHKNILGARSPAFKAMFQHDVAENRIFISDISFKVLLELVRFIYTGKVPEMDEEMAMQLFSAADKYALKDLKEICDKTLSAKLTVENIAQLIPLARLHDARHLKARLVEIMKSQATGDVFNHLWMKMIDEQPQLVAWAFQATPGQNRK